MGGEKVALALILVLLNIIAFAPTPPGNYIVPAGILLWIIATLAGYIASKSRDVLLIVSEFISLIVANVAKPGVWASSIFMAQNVGILSLLYFLGFLGGAAFREGPRLIRPSLSPSKMHFPLFVGALGICLLLTSLYMLLAFYVSKFILFTSLSQSILVVSISLIASILSSYALSARGIGYPTNPLISGAISSLSFLTFPLSVSIMPEIPETPVLPREAIRLGKSIKAFRKGRHLMSSIVYYIPRFGANNHITVTGPTGTGKTTYVRNIIKQARRLGVNSVILDFHGEYRDISDFVLHPSKERVNMVALLGVNPRTRAEEVAEEIASNYRLGNIQRAALHQLLLKSYAIFGDEVTPAKLLELLKDEDFVNSLGFGKDVIRSLQPYISSLGSERVKWIHPSRLLTGIISVDLSEVESISLQQLIVESILDIMYYLRKNESGITLLVLEEAHRVSARKRTESLYRILREGRKFGLSIIAVFQDPLKIDPGLINNSSQFVVFRMIEESSRNYLAKVLTNGLPKSGKLAGTVKKELASLKVGEAIVRIENELYLISTLIRRASLE